MLCGSRNIGMFIAARLFAGAGSWGFLAVTPIYCAELAPPDLRGLMVGSKSIRGLVLSCSTLSVRRRLTFLCSEWRQYCAWLWSRKLPGTRILLCRLLGDAVACPSRHSPGVAIYDDLRLLARARESQMVVDEWANREGERGHIQAAHHQGRPGPRIRSRRVLPDEQAS
jgi:hypothetical protein